jgi:protein-S-isoprenylcysteine O-methyltransferase Ste14
MGVAVFVSAGTLDYWEAWVFLGVFGGSGLVTTVYLMRNDPRLLERRLHGGPAAEKETTQRVVMSIASIGFVAILVVSALDHRMHWSAVPGYAAIGGDVLVLLGWIGIIFVFRENPFTSAVIELAAEQRVISTGPYAVVRHPMYGFALIYLLGIPIALGSWWGLCVVVLMVPALVWRLLDEETFLAKSLQGYSEYRSNRLRKKAPASDRF